MVIIRDERKEALKNRETRRLKAIARGGSKTKGLKHSSSISRGTSPSQEVQTVTASVPIPQPQAGTQTPTTPTTPTQTPVSFRVRTADPIRSRTSTFDNDGYETTTTTVGKPGGATVDITANGTSIFTETERESLAYGTSKQKRKKPKQEIDFTYVSPVGELRKDIAFEREGKKAAGKFTPSTKAFSGFYPNTLIPRITTRSDPQEARLMQDETGLRALEIIERGGRLVGKTVTDRNFTKQHLIPVENGKNPYEIKSNFSEEIKQLQKVVIPSAKEVKSNPTSLLATTGALAFQIGATSVLTSAPTPAKTVKVVQVKPKPADINIFHKGKTVDFATVQKFNVKVQQPQAPVGFRVPKRFGGLGNDPKTLLNYNVISSTQGQVVGTGKASSIGSRSYSTVTNTKGEVIHKNFLSQESSGTATNKLYSQSSDIFDPVTGKVIGRVGEFGAKTIIIEGGKKYTVINTGVQVGKTGGTTSSILKFKESPIPLPSLGKGVTGTAKGIKFYKGTVDSTSVNIHNLPAPGGLGKSGQLALGVRPVTTHATVPLSRVTVPTTTIGQSVLSTSKTVLSPTSTRLGLASLTSLAPARTTTVTRGTTRTVTIPAFSTAVIPRTALVPTTRLITPQKTTPVTTTKLVTRTVTTTRLITPTATTTTPFIPTNPIIPPPPPPGILFGGGGGLSSSSGALTNLTGGKFGFVPSLVGQTFGIGATGGKIFSGLGVRQRKKKGRKK